MLFETEQRGDIYIVRIGGRLATGADTEYLRTKTQEIKSLGCRKLVADIRELDSAGSEGIGFFVSLYTSMTKDPGGCFVLAGPSRRVLEVLTLTRLNTIIPLAADLAAGLAFCAREDGRASQRE